MDRIGEPSRHPEPIFYSPQFQPNGNWISTENQRQIQEPVAFLDDVFKRPTESGGGGIGSLNRPYELVNTAADLSSYTNWKGTTPQPNEKEQLLDYPTELRPLSEHEYKIPYNVKPTGWATLKPLKNEPENGILSTADTAFSSPFQDGLGSTYNSIGDMGVGGLAFGTQAGAGLGFKLQVGGYNYGSLGILDNAFGTKSYGSDSLIPYDVNALYNPNQQDRPIDNAEWNILQNPTKYPGKTNPPKQPGGDIKQTPYLNLEGKHYLCPPATMADRYSYCTDTSNCMPDTVQIVPIKNLVNHYYCTDPHLPYNTLQSCPDGHVLVDNKSACVSTRPSSKK